jgi:hypothetical protein
MSSAYAFQITESRNITESRQLLKDMNFSEEELTSERVEAFHHSIQSDIFSNPAQEEFEELEPTYFKDTAGDCLLTPGLVHWLYGPSETGKSFIAMTACLEVAGIYVSLEMGKRTTASRLSKMGFHVLDSQRFIFPNSQAEMLSALEFIKSAPPTVVVIDAYGELSTMFGLDTNIDSNVATMFEQIITPLAEAGHAVVVIDHIAKSTKTIDHPLGTQNKKSQSDVCFYINVDSDTGMLKLIVTKDRHEVFYGRYTGEGREYGNVELTHQPTRAVIQRFGHETFNSVVVHNSAQRTLQDRIIAAVESGGPMSKSDLSAIVVGKDASRQYALKELINNGYLEIRKEKNQESYLCQMVYRTELPWIPIPKPKR